MLRSLFPSANSTSAVEDNLVTLQVRSLSSELSSKPKEGRKRGDKGRDLVSLLACSFFLAPPPTLTSSRFVFYSVALLSLSLSLSPYAVPQAKQRKRQSLIPIREKQKNEQTKTQVGKRVFPNVSPSLRRELWLSVLQRSRAASRAAAAYPSLLSSAFPQRSAAAASAAAVSAAAAEEEEEEEEEGAGEGGGETKEGTVPLEVVEAIRRDVGRTFPAVAGFEPEDPCVPSSPRDSSFSSSSKQRLPMLGRRARSLANILTAYGEASIISRSFRRERESEKERHSSTNEDKKTHFFFTSLALDLFSFSR